MDIQMPVMNGYEATTAIRASEREDLKYLPIVAMSADVFMDDVKHAWNVGMNGHIPKPVEIENLVGVLEKWIG
jgi:CheY-like chemotaxis protein